MAGFPCGRCCGSGGQDPKRTMSCSIPLTADIGGFVIPPRQWRSTGTRASAGKTRRWPNAAKVIVGERAHTASKPITASVIGWTTATLGCSSWATRQAVHPMGGLKEPTAAGSKRTAITRSPKSHKSSIRRSDLSTAGADEGVPTIGPVVFGSETDRMWTGRVSSAVTSPGTGTHGPESSSADVAVLRPCPLRSERVVGRIRVGSDGPPRLPCDGGRPAPVPGGHRRRRT
jgi:hypothetical protein